MTTPSHLSVHALEVSDLPVTWLSKREGDVVVLLHQPLAADELRILVDQVAQSYSVGP